MGDFHVVQSAITGYDMVLTHLSIGTIFPESFISAAHSRLIQGFAKDRLTDDRSA